MKLLLALLLLVPAIAVADEAPEEATADEAPQDEAPEEATADEAPAVGPASAFATVSLLKDRTGGALLVVRKASRECEIVRHGETQPATPEMILEGGDAIRCGQGIAALSFADGTRVEVGERSQLRLDPGRLTQRLGDVLIATPTALSVVVGDAEIAVEGTSRITSTLQLEGVVQTLAGRARIIAGDTERVLEAGQATDVGVGDGAVRSLTADQVAAAEAPREEFTVKEKTPLESTDRANILIAGGISIVDRAEWAQVDLAARIRLGGPVWLRFGAGLTIRPAEELAGYTTVLALPVRFGVRFIAQLPRSAYLLGGADLSLLFGERCTSLEGCPREFSVEPGGLVALGAGVYIHPRLGLQLELGGGLYRHRLPPPGPGLVEVSFPDFQFHVLIGLFVRI